jgi:hypothetical protein
METRDRGNPPRQSIEISIQTSTGINIKTRDGNRDRVRDRDRDRDRVRDRVRAFSAKVNGPAGPY